MVSINNHKVHTGVALIETLIAALVVAIGITAVVYLQMENTSQSSDNKARTEAMAIAQGRIEDLRNYTNDLGSAAEFAARFADTDGFTNSNAFGGTNASFTREEVFAQAGDTVAVGVRVSWLDAKNRQQQVLVNTELAWQPPRSVGDLAVNTFAASVPSPTGKAEIVDIEVPDNATLTSNPDGTRLWVNNNDLLLVLDGRAILSLKDACAGQTCTDFVRISGRVYVDTDTQNNLDPGEVFIKASDAAYCHLYYGGDSIPSQVTTSTSVGILQANDHVTANGDYYFFDYTCYLGGGWYGNIGVLLDGGIAQTDKVCLGDPTSADAWAEPVIAARRSYRGMLYRLDASNVSGANAGKYVDADGDVLYYENGIRDGLALPLPGEHTHDFVIARLSNTQTAGSNCVTQGVMVRADATVDGVAGGLFAGNPTDFVCLNLDDQYSTDYDSGVYAPESNCPYDPADPPSTQHRISGSITINADESLADDVASLTVETSDGLGNCLFDPFEYAAGEYTTHYDCGVFDWGMGWSGFIQMKGNFSQISCSSLPLVLMNVTGDTAGNNVVCESGNKVIVEGSIDQSNANKTIETITMSGTTTGSCIVSVDQTSYRCDSGIFVESTWSGTVTYTPNGGVVCENGTGVSSGSVGTLTLTGEIPGTQVQNIWVQHNNLNSCP